MLLFAAVRSKLQKAIEQRGRPTDLREWTEVSLSFPSPPLQPQSRSSTDSHETTFIARLLPIVASHIQILERWYWLLLRRSFQNNSILYLRMYLPRSVYRETEEAEEVEEPGILTDLKWGNRMLLEDFNLWALEVDTQRNWSPIRDSLDHWGMYCIGMHHSGLLVITFPTQRIIKVWKFTWLLSKEGFVHHTPFTLIVP